MLALSCAQQSRALDWSTPKKHTVEWRKKFLNGSGFGGGDGFGGSGVARREEEMPGRQ